MPVLHLRQFLLQVAVPPHNCAGSKLEFAQISAATVIPETLSLKSACTPNKTLLNTDY